MTDKNFSKKQLKHLKNETYAEAFKNIVQSEYTKIELGSLGIEIEKLKPIVVRRTSDRNLKKL